MRHVCIWQPMRNFKNILEGKYFNYSGIKKKQHLRQWKKEQHPSLAILKDNQSNSYKDSRHLGTARYFSTNSWKVHWNYNFHGNRQPTARRRDMFTLSNKTKNSVQILQPGHWGTFTMTEHKVVSIQDLFQANLYFRLNGSCLNEVSIMPSLSLSYM